MSPRRASVPRAAVAGWAVGAATVFFLLRRWRSFGISDEGFRYLLSRTWARGESLFETFEPIYVTGEYVWYGSLMALLGEPLWVLRLGNAILGGVAVAIFWRSLRPHISPWTAAAAAAALVATISPEPKFLAMALVVAAALRLAVDEPPGRPWVFGAFVLSGTLLAVREDAAVLMGLVGCAAVLLRRRPREFLSLGLPGLVLGFLPWLGIEAVRGDGPLFLTHVAHRVAFLFQRLEDPLSVPWHLPTRIPADLVELRGMVNPWIALLTVGTYAAVAARQARRWWRGDPVERVPLAALLAALAFLPQYLWERPDLYHFQAHLPALIVVLALTWGSAQAAGWRALFLVAVLTLTAGAFGRHAWVLSHPTYPYPTSAAQAAGLALHAPAPPWAGLPREPGETMIVLRWGPGWYVLEDMPAGTRFLSTSPRHLAAVGNAERLVEEVRRPTNRWLITKVERRHGQPRGPLDEAVERHYERRDRWLEWVLWERARTNPVEAPGAADSH